MKLKDGRDANFVCWTCKSNLKEVHMTPDGRCVYTCEDYTCKQVNNLAKECVICRLPRRFAWSDEEERICLGCWVKTLDTN